MSLPGHLVESVHTRRGLLGNPADAGCHFVPVFRRTLQTVGQALPNDFQLLVVTGLFQYRGVIFHPHAFMDHQRCIAAVVYDQIGSRAVGPGQRLLGTPPVLLQGLTLPRKHGGGSRLGDRGRGMVLRGEDVTGRPAEIGPQFLQRLYQHGSLNGHVQAAHNLQPGQRFFWTVLFPDGHQARHLVFGKTNLLPAPGRQRPIGNLAGEVFIHLQKFHGSRSLFGVQLGCFPPGSREVFIWRYNPR